MTLLNNILIPQPAVGKSLFMFHELKKLADTGEFEHIYDELKGVVWLVRKAAPKYAYVEPSGVEDAIVEAVRAIRANSNRNGRMYANDILEYCKKDIKLSLDMIENLNKEWYLS